MPPSRQTLGHLELDVLRYIAGHHPISVRDVARRFAETSGHARTTLLTVMERLRSKGYLKRRKLDGAQRYSPTVAKSEFLQQMIGDFVGNVLGGSVSPFVAYLTNSPRQLTAEEARKLTELLKRIESKKKGDRHKFKPTSRQNPIGGSRRDKSTMANDESRPVALAGKDGNDAKNYQAKAVKRAIRETRS